MLEWTLAKDTQQGDTEKKHSLHADEVLYCGSQDPSGWYKSRVDTGEVYIYDMLHQPRFVIDALRAELP